MAISLTREQAKQIAADYQYLVGRTFMYHGKNMTVAAVTPEDSNIGSYTVIVTFELLNSTWLPSDTIDNFLAEVSIEFDLNKYLNGQD